jgi:BASS family bile acid:Na+ symporter
MSGIINKYATLLVIVLSIILGFALPQVGLIWKPFLVPLLMLLMFSLTLTVEPNEIARSLNNYRVVGIGVFTVFVLTPLLSLISGIFFSPIVYAGVVLALCCPSAVATAFWAKVFRGDIAVAIVISVVTNLLSIFTIPVTMLIAVGAAVNVDVAGMMLNLAEIVLIPMTASFLLRKIVHTDWIKLGKYNSRIELGILVLLVWGSIAPGVAYTLNNLGQFAVLNVFMLTILAAVFVLTHFLTEKLGHQRAISIGIAATVKNAALSLVIGLTAFGSGVLPPLVANLVAQNLLLVVAKALTKEIG